MTTATKTPATRDELVSLIEEGLRAFHFTREYVDPTGQLLPPIEGWSWYDWTEKAKRVLAEEGRR